MASLLYALLPAVFLAIALIPEAAGDLDLVVISVNRTTSVFGFVPRLTFIIKYTATAEPTVDWMMMQTKLQFGSLSHNDSTGEGSTSITILPGFPLHFQIGQPKQFISFQLNTFLSPDGKFQELNLHSSTVSPSLDVSYESGVDGVPIQTMTVNKVMGTDVTLLSNSLTYGGNHIVNDINHVLYSWPNIRQQNKIVQTDATDSATTVFSFNSIPGVHKLSGYFAGFYYGYNTAVNSPIGKYVYESFFLSVHDDSDTGPFPDDEVWARFLGGAKNCRAGRFCSIICNARGNAVSNVTISRVYENGTMSELTSYILKIDNYWKKATTWIPFYDEDRSGQYKCQATGDTAGVTGEATITVTDLNAVEVDSLTLDEATNTVTCDVRGDAVKPLMTVHSCLSREQQTYDITWGANAAAGDEFSQIASVDLSGSSESCLRVSCGVSNAVSYDFAFVNVFLSG